MIYAQRDEQRGSMWHVTACSDGRIQLAFGDGPIEVSISVPISRAHAIARSLSSACEQVSSVRVILREVAVTRKDERLRMTFGDGSIELSVTMLVAQGREVAAELQRVCAEELEAISDDQE